VAAGLPRNRLPLRLIHQAFLHRKRVGTFDA
jgi:hypothetical protein